MRRMKVVVRDGEIEKALKVLRRKLVREGVMRDMKRRNHYEKPSEVRRRKHAEAVGRARRAARKLAERDA